MSKHFLLFSLALLLILPAMAQRPRHIRERVYTHRSFGGSKAPNTLSVNLMIGGFGLGYGLGGEYERAFGEKGLFSIHLPFGYSKSNDVPFLQVADVGDRYHYYSAFFMAPGFRYHPAGSYRPADFSFGLQLAIGSLEMKEDHIGFVPYETNYSSTFVSPMLDINLDIVSRDSFVFGVYAGGGPVLSGEFGTATNGTPNNRGAFVMTGIKLGGRF